MITAFLAAVILSCQGRAATGKPAQERRTDLSGIASVVLPAGIGQITGPPISTFVGYFPYRGMKVQLSVMARRTEDGQLAPLQWVAPPPMPSREVTLIAHQVNVDGVVATLSASGFRDPFMLADEFFQSVDAVMKMDQAWILVSLTASSRVELYDRRTNQLAGELRRLLASWRWNRG